MNYKIYKMMPALKISALVSYPRSFKISGATYPGEPHLILRMPSFVEAESPKSTIFKDDMLSFLNWDN
jgi:hypothetical protein